MRHIDDCKTIINYLGKKLEYSDLYFESGSMRSDLFYQRKIVEYFIKEATRRLHFGFEVHAEISGGTTQLICKCEDRETAEFIMSALRHGMPRYWDVKEIEDEDRNISS